MKKLASYTLIAFFLIAFAFLGFGIMKKIDQKTLMEKKISSFPSFTYLTLSGLSFDSRSLCEGPVLIVRFNPGCENCKYEISEIAKSRIPSSGIKLIFITTAERDKVIAFLDPLNLLGDQNIIPLLDTAGSFGKVFGSNNVPSIYIYDKSLRLVKSFYGEYKIETILKYLPL